MGESGDLIKEFKGAKPPEKAVIILGGVAVVGIGAYLYLKSKAGSSTPATSAQTSYGTSTGGSGGSLPSFAPGTTVLSDANGNPIGTITPPVTAPPSNPVPPPGTNISPLWFTNILGNLGYGTNVTAGGVDPTQGQRFWTSKTNFFYAPVGSSISNGSQGRVWLNIPGQQHQLLTGPGMTPSSTVVSTVAAGSNH